MADSNISIQKTIKNEGGYQNMPEDTGNWLNGINYGTKWGITPHTLQAYFPALLSDPNCVLNLDMTTALSCYRQGYWKQHYSEINDQNMADKLFDMGVLFGVGTAVKMLQLSLSLPGKIVVAPDGAFGPNTLAATNDHGNVETYRSVLLRHCVDIVNQNPNDTKFLNGWIARIQS
jgi:lysozyme family protein